ncbi:hypothetical protein B0T22DRAFT_520548 [Podospora appendiculata]|uniref:Thioredoxin domain-containing protein n=1 Tax=Podospora appendiculata TaxID=314037 RepID=A0AAE0X3K1_9PEZI|nr:hypothetical protein B0T22DRAFT_520548 [Podospora appendiculata]
MLQETLGSSAYTFVACEDESKALETEWVDMEKTENDPNVMSFDCEAHLKTCKDLDVVSFPAIRLYHRDGRLDRYRGERKTRDMGLFLHRSFHPSVLDTDENTLGPMSLLDDVVIVSHAHPDDWPFFERFTALANRYRDRYTFLRSPSPNGGSHTASSLSCYNNLDDERHATTAIETVDALDAFVSLCAAPLIPELTRRNEARYTGSGKSILHFFAAGDAQKETFRHGMRDLAKKYAEFLHVAVTDVDDYPEMPKVMGLEAGAKTGLALENPNTGEVFPYPAGRSISPREVEAFLNEVIEGKVKSSKAGQANGRVHEEL